MNPLIAYHYLHLLYNILLVPLHIRCSIYGSVVSGILPIVEADAYFIGKQFCLLSLQA